MVSPVGVGPGPQPYQPLTASAQPGADVETGAPSTETLADRLKLADELSAQAAEQAKPQDVGQLTAREAKARHDQLSLMQRAGVFQYMGVNAVLKGEKTSSLDTYMGGSNSASPENKAVVSKRPGDPWRLRIRRIPSPRSTTIWRMYRRSGYQEARAERPKPSGGAASSGAGSVFGLKADDPAGLEPEWRVPAPRGSAYASIARMQATTATASQVVAELSNLAARMQVSDKPVDVDTLSPEAARSQHEQLTALKRLGSPFLNIGVAAFFSDQPAFDVGKLAELLNGRSADDAQGSATVPPSLLDFKA